MHSFFGLFEGIGGFRLGLEKAGFSCAGACEIDPYARRIYASNYGREPEFSDARKLDARAVPPHDVLAAGFPCQPFSTAGKRLGFTDTRGTLFHEICRIAREKRPRILLLENVKGLLYHDEQRTFITMLAALDELGYDVEWQVIDGKYFLPQSRERIFIVGHARDHPSAQIFPLQEGPQEHACVQQAQQGKGQRLGDRRDHVKTIDTTLSKYSRSGTMIAHSAVVHSAPRGIELRHDGLSHCIKGGAGGASKIHLAVLRPNHKEVRQKGRRLKASEMFTLNASEPHGITDGAELRRLTPLECERLQGFPDNWTACVSDTRRYIALGNAVMPPVVEFIGNRIRQVLEG